ncbi:unnamed protein product [Adineta steineri]|uniref:Uncharacterized protein n=2 Tax=Adineta steineri TaxID=433720 RepID=A0A813VLG7_9BILA|nr:unnamed protein product [Adineta steineri]CAF0889401.1 unnamed protein product [Adineta steineri]CAF0904973.1 unnamed protein product [Adineta steineri]CAF1165263.1 unnamed protein product [Adineta steineri]CAF1474596.1 unnamed protein product [Adineta steineri]
MENDFTPGADPEEIKHYLHGLGLIPLDEYYVQLKKLLKRQRHSSKMTIDQIQRKLAENGIFKDDLSRNPPILHPRKRTSFSPVITRKRGKAIKKRTPSATQVITTTSITSTSTISSTDEKSNETDTIDYDQPLDLRLRPNLSNKT